VAFCKSCGQDIGAAAFCPKCGASQSVAAAPVAMPAASPTPGLLCYLPGPGWIIALVLFLIDKRSFVKFHAAQSLILSVSMIVLGVALGTFMGILHMMHIFFLGLFLYPLLWLAIFLLLLFMMYKAYLNEKYKLPVIGDMAEGFASK
jgi:uncharacterized membrane protein